MRRTKPGSSIVGRGDSLFRRFYRCFEKKHSGRNAGATYAHYLRHYAR